MNPIEYLLIYYDLKESELSSEGKACLDIINDQIEYLKEVESSDLKLKSIEDRLKAIEAKLEFMSKKKEFDSNFKLLNYILDN